MSRYKIKRKRTPGQQLKEEAKKINLKLWLITFISVLCIFGVYQLCVYFAFKPIVHIYAVAAGILAVCFFVFNKGLSNQKLTLDDLPSDWDEGRKEAFLKSRRKAKLFLIPLIGILLTFAFDIIYLFYLDPVL